MPKFQRKVVVIEAIQLCWANWSELCTFLGSKIISETNPGREANEVSDTCGEVGPTWIELSIPTLEGSMLARHGDWIVKGVKGEFYPVKPDIFKLLYDPVPDESGIPQPLVALDQVEMSEYLMATTNANNASCCVEAGETDLLRDGIRSSMRFARFNILGWLMQNGVPIPSHLLSDQLHKEVGQQFPDQKIIDWVPDESH